MSFCCSLRDGQMGLLSSSPAQPENNTGQHKGEAWLPSGQLYFSAVKMKHYTVIQPSVRAGQPN